ncbi:hypothetical protein LHK_00480 [Laribacter hongkongensis HLHK9]|uniref:Uncharacterized protein n=1 Tax=Laribacter hongkongensis (strain HLHK9) TaxID=557598 RepID=C1DC54_LARHH|nr:hypothetical protein LHK_00480 [Laribacter hongkongensis HLHK9]
MAGDRFAECLAAAGPVGPEVELPGTGTDGHCHHPAEEPVTGRATGTLRTGVASGRRGHKPRRRAPARGFPAAMCGLPEPAGGRWSAITGRRPAWRLVTACTVADLSAAGGHAPGTSVLPLAGVQAGQRGASGPFAAWPASGWLAPVRKQRYRQGFCLREGPCS